MLTIVSEGRANIIHGQDPAALPALLANKSGLFWVDLESPAAEEFHLLQEVFNFHPLAVEDAMRPHQRPKVDEYEGYFFLVADEVALQLPANGDDSTSKDGESDDVQSRQLSAFLGANYLVTVHLTTRDFPNIQQTTLPYFRDVADHLFRIYETLDSYRDLMSNMLDAYLSQVSNQMNRVMQRSAVVATIFLPITFITGVFGMNFAVQPWLNTSVWFWLFMMASTVAVIYWWLRHRQWV